MHNHRFSLASIFTAFVALLCLTSSLFAQTRNLTRQEIANVMREVIAPEANCFWGNGSPICRLDVTVGTIKNYLSLIGGSEQYFANALHTTTLARSPESQRQMQMFVAFISKLGFEGDEVRSCLRRADENRLNNARTNNFIVLGTADLSHGNMIMDCSFKLWAADPGPRAEIEITLRPNNRF
jgi:hypothetical protein